MFRGPTGDRSPLLPLLAALVIGGLCLYAAVGLWLGVAQAIGGDRTPGTVRDVHCGYRQSCSGTFTSADGSIRDRRLRVSGLTRGTAEAHGTLVRKIHTGLVGSIQSDDTVYVDIGVAGSVTIAVILSLLGLVLFGPLLVTGVLIVRRAVRG